MLEAARVARRYEFRARDANLIVFTNGMLLNAQRLRQVKAESMQLLISFDGFGERSALRYGKQCQELAAKVAKVISDAVRTSIPTTVVFTVGRHNVEFLLGDMERLHDQHGVCSFSVVTLRRNDLAAQNLHQTRDAVVRWAGENKIDMDWKPVEQRGLRYDSYFLSARHARHLFSGEAGTWGKTGW